MQTQIILRLQQKFRNEAHKIFTEKFNKIAFSFNDNKKLQSFNKLKLYRATARNVCKDKLLLIIKNNFRAYQNKEIRLKIWLVLAMLQEKIW